MKLSTLNVAFVAIALAASQAIALPIVEGAVDQVDAAAYPRTTAPIEDKRGSSTTTGTVKSIDFSVTPPTGSKTVAPGSKFDEDKNFDYGHYADPKWSTKRQVVNDEREEVTDKRAFGYIQATDPKHSSWRLLRREDQDFHDEASLFKKAFGYIWATSPKHATGDRDRRRDDVDSPQDESLAKKAFGYIWATSPKHATGDRNRRRDDLDASEVEARWLSAYVITKPKYSTGDHLRRREDQDISSPAIASRFDTPSDWWRSTFGDNGRRDADHMWDHGQKKPNFGWTPGGEGQGSFDDGRRAVEEEES